jgi:hypothetical protein
MPKTSTLQASEKETAVATKAPPAPQRAESPRPAPRPVAEEQRRPTTNPAAESSRRKIVSSKHTPSGSSAALIGSIVALCAAVGTVLFFLFVKR